MALIYDQTVSYSTQAKEIVKSSMKCPHNRYARRGFDSVGKYAIVILLVGEIGDARDQAQILGDTPIPQRLKTKPQRKLGFLGIAKPTIVKVELSRRVLLRHQEARRLEKKVLQIIVFDRRLLVQLDDCCLFCDRDFSPRYFRHDAASRANCPEVSELQGPYP